MNASVLGELRAHTLTQITDLLSSQVKNMTFAESITALVADGYQEMAGKIDELEQILNIKPDSSSWRPLLDQLREEVSILSKTLETLFTERRSQWQNNISQTIGVMQKTSWRIQKIQTLLIEKELLDRQSQVLSEIILSTEKISLWKEFVQKILAKFQEMFPFDLFFIAFLEEHNLSLFLYYKTTLPEPVREEIRKRFIRDMAMELGHPTDSPCEVEEFFLSSEPGSIDLDAMKTLTVNVPEYHTELSGILGVSYLFNRELIEQETSILKSILSVMVMVIGSSKVISRTLLELSYYSTHDPLTDIHNRRYFNEIMDYEIDRCQRHDRPFCLLMIDLDNFKDVNDTYGHLSGDMVLREIASLFRQTIRKGDVLCRFGGDEFVILLSETAPQGGIVLAETLRKLLQKNEFLSDNGDSFHVTASIGLVNFPQDGTLLHDLLTGMDLVLYRAKELGKNIVSQARDIESSIRVARLSRMHVEEFQKALEEKRIQPYFQGIHETATRKLIGYETLARLKNTDGSIVSAADFIHMAQKYALVPDLDAQMIEQSIRALANHQKQTPGGVPRRLFINLSSQEIENRDFLSIARSVAGDVGIPAEQIVFEITEREAIGDISGMKSFLSELRENGFSFALDDFGSGYNSFHYLRDLHFEYVKIDGAFIQNMVRSKTDRTLVKNLACLCRDLGIRTIGEYVETSDILEMLHEMEIDFVQGFFLSTPGAYPQEQS